MATFNPHFKKIPKGYFTAEVFKRTKAFLDSHPGTELHKLGVGNTTEPLAPSVIAGLRRGVEKLASAETYSGYGDEQGDARLRKAISEWYGKRGIDIDATEVFVSDGAKSDCANIASIFRARSVIAIADPVYPVYRDSNILTGNRIVYMPVIEKNGFAATPPKEKVDIIFLCSPNNPTGAIATRRELKEFVAYAKKYKAVIVFDAAYSEYISDAKLPKSIYEIEGAESCAIEIQSFSKSAGFTGVRLGWSIVPMALRCENSARGELNQHWNRRQTTMFNGASNIAQEGGLSILSQIGQKETHAQIAYYMKNAEIIRKGLEAVGMTVFGGIHAPYLWVKCPKGLSSWEFFDTLLEKAHVITIPGSGFGKNGEGYMRLSACDHRENIEKAVRSIRDTITL